MARIRATAQGDTAMKLPSCVDIEKLVLGSTIAKAEHLELARGLVEPSDFSLEKHQLMWHTLCELYDHGKSVDSVILHRELGLKGNQTSLSDIAELSVVLADPESYIERLKETATRRKAIVLLASYQDRYEDETIPSDDITADLLTRFGEIGVSDRSNGPIGTARMLDEHGMDKLLGPRYHKGIKFPFSRLEESMCGMSAGQLIVLMAATSRGKTSMALQMSTAAAVQGYTPVMWTMEMSPFSLYRRLAMQISGTQVGRSNLTFEERASLCDATAQLYEKQVYFDATSRTVSKFKSSIRQVGGKSRVGLAVVDYLQLIRGTGRMASRAQEVSDNSRSLKLMAMDLGIPVLVLSQVDRSSVKNGGKIDIHSPKESGDIENDADAILWIEAGELKRDEVTSVKLHVGKQREGPAGFSIPMNFKPTSQTFEEVQDSY